MANDILSLTDVTVSFEGFKALQNLSFSIEKGEMRVVIGPNGAGKTTLLDVITGKVRPISGKVQFNGGVNLLKMQENEIANLGIGRKFQTPSVFHNHEVFENMELSVRRSRNVSFTLTARLSAEQTEKIHSILETVKLAEAVHDKAGSLSHGQKQWLEIAMLMAQDPQLILVDEPVAGMTGGERMQTAELLQRISQNHSLLVIEHDMEFVRQLNRKVTVLHEGMLLCEGTMQEVQNDPLVIEVYLGRSGEAVANN